MLNSKFLSVLIITIATAFLTSCSSTQSNKTVSKKAYIQKSQLKGWKQHGNGDIYICKGKPVCPNLAVSVYKSEPASASTIKELTNLDKNPNLARRQFALGFALAGGNGIAPDGNPETLNISGIKSVGMKIKGKNKDGSPRDPGYMILIPANGRIHIFVGISATKSEAKTTAFKIANALRFQ